MKTELTPEESQHLIDLGAPKEKARCELPIGDGVYVFSFTDLLVILPWWIKDEAWGFIEELTTRYDKQEDWWWAGYNGGECFSAPELIDALYKLACWFYGEYLKSEKK